jgi:hypothetical protein
MMDLLHQGVHMAQDFVEGIIRRSNRNLLLICLLGIAIVAGVAAMSANYLYNFFNGPFPINTQDILAINDLNQQQQYFVTVRGADALDSGYQYVRTYDDGRETVEANYPVLLIGDYYLLVKTPGDPSGREYTGALVPISGEVQREIIDDIGQDYPKVRDAFLPFMLDATDFRGHGSIGRPYHRWSGRSALPVGIGARHPAKWRLTAASHHAFAGAIWRAADDGAANQRRSHPPAPDSRKTSFHTELAAPGKFDLPQGHPAE